MWKGWGRVRCRERSEREEAWPPKSVRLVVEATSMIHRRHAPFQKSLSCKGSGFCSGKNGLGVEGEKAIVVVVQRMPGPLPMVKARVLIRMCSLRGYCVIAYEHA